VQFTLNHVSLRVTSLAQACRFYTGVLGLEPHPQKPNWMGFGQGCLIHLMEPTLDSADAAVDPARHVALEVSSLEAVVTLLLRHGLKPYQATVDQRQFREITSTGTPLDFGIGTVFVKDPDGNVIEFVQKGRGIFGQFDPS
jgi:catechol 2,3-dioxygenase-like lactoylglutathione lyase family enzyme